MLSQSFLIQLEKEYPFSRANQVLAEDCLKANWKPWLVTELSLALLRSNHQCHINELFYPARAADNFLKFDAASHSAIDAPKRQASRADMAMTLNRQPIFVELRCEHYLTPLSKALVNFDKDIQRVKALKKKNPGLSAIAMLALYGRFSSAKPGVLANLDNGVQTCYALDTHESGSSSVSRLCQVKKEGKNRMILAAFSPK